MKPKLVIDVCAIKDEPTYQVRIDDFDRHTNFHSFDCLCFEKGDDLKDVLKNVASTRYGKQAIKEMRDIMNEVLNEK